MSEKMTYHVGVQRWPLPLFKRYTVHGHETETIGGVTRLILSCKDGSTLAVPGLDRKKLKIYPDFKREMLRLQLVREAAEAQMKEMEHQKLLAIEAAKRALKQEA